MLIASAITLIFLCVLVLALCMWSYWKRMASVWQNAYEEMRQNNLRLLDNIKELQDLMLEKSKEASK